MDGKKLALKWFTKLDEDETTWVCRCGVRRKKSGLGYTNLVSHIQQSHVQKQESTLSVYSSKAGKIYAWLRIICLSLLPFSTVENKNIIPFMVMEPICYNTFIKYLNHLTEVVEKKLRKGCLKKFV